MLAHTFGGFHVVVVAALILNYNILLIFPHLIGPHQEFFFKLSFIRKLRFFMIMLYTCVCTISGFVYLYVIPSPLTPDSIGYFLTDLIDREVCFKNANCFQEKVGC